MLLRSMHPLRGNNIALSDPGRVEIRYIVDADLQADHQTPGSMTVALSDSLLHPAFLDTSVLSRREGPTNRHLIPNSTVYAVTKDQPPVLGLKGVTIRLHSRQTSDDS